VNVVGNPTKSSQPRHRISPCDSSLTSVWLEISSNYQIFEYNRTQWDIGPVQNKLTSAAATPNAAHKIANIFSNKIQ
jgi:hypothetical protein